MKLVSSYDNAWEQHERVMAKDHLRTALADAKAAQESLADSVFFISQLIEGAVDLDELERAGTELHEALVKLELLKAAMQYAAVLMREVDDE